MLIAGIGISNTLISFINQKNISIAIMKSLGFTSINEYNNKVDLLARNAANAND